MTALPLEIESRIEEIRAEIGQNGAELVEVIYRRANQRSILTFLVDKEGGVTLEECAALNQRLGSFFDRLAEIAPGDAGFLQGAYFLEVNSPGLDRPLKTSRDFQRVLGKTLRVQSRPPVRQAGDSRGTVDAVVGKLTGLSGTGIELEVGDAKRSISFEEILKATREVEWKK